MVGALVLAFTALGGAAPQQKDNMPLDKEFLIKTITCNQFEIKASEMAETRSSNVKVKSFAHQLVKDHKALETRLNDLAKDQKVAVLAGTEKELKTQLDRLSSASADSFDREYLKAIIEDHEKGVQMFENQGKRGTDNALKTFATNTLPTLQTHLMEAKKLSVEVSK